jgi:hypothetical protein|tara:strand:+ start:869 stop:1063 length:195 start_codon:yes stop_codon:yes gene_type:complete
MRILLEQNKILFSMTKEETQKIQDNHHNPIEITKGQLMVLHEDISKAIMEEWRKEVWKKSQSRS